MRVYKWIVDDKTGRVIIPWSSSDRVVLVAWQPGDGRGGPIPPTPGYNHFPFIWTQSDDEGGLPLAREFVVVGTGDRTPEGYEHVGSAASFPDARLVWHVYAAPPLPVEEAFVREGSA